MRSYLFIGNKKCRIYAACGVSQTPKYFTNIYEEWMEHKVKPYILELLAAVNAGVVSDTENKLFTNVLNEWLETSYDIVNT